ncbi:MAG TPA: hypothetical protein VMJ10_34580 [Kofleriaceae bacterium]|nr:hypothetical protein [Kofleriaceae bacterium]
MTIAAGTGLESAELQPRHDLQCMALQRMGISHPIPHHLNPAALHRVAAALEQQSVRDAIAALLSDDVSWCKAKGTGGETSMSPSEAISRLLVDFPVPSLQQDLERAASRDEAAHRDGEAHAALQTLKLERDYREGPRAAKIDEMVAEGSPQSFDRLIAFVADGMPWNDGQPPATGDEAREITEHVQDAFEWLLTLAKAAPHGANENWNCAQDIQEALIDGDLGQHLLARFEKLDADSRYHMLYMMTTVQPRGFAEWRLQIAKSDPDPRIRALAAP